MDPNPLAVPRAELLRRDALAALLREVRTPRTAATRGLPSVGHYAGVIRAGTSRIAVTTDTVGTKVILAEKLNRWEEVGEDLVTVNTNDLAAIGARPLGLVDTLSVPGSDANRFRAIGRGMNRGLRAAGCSLLGGETAVVPDLVRHMDLGGTAVGFFPGQRAPVTGETIRPNDLIIGLPARGFHSNGYTLLRRVLRSRRIDLHRARVGARRPLGEELLEPTRCYVGASEALVGVRGVHGFAHISGGGVRNLVRLRRSVRFVLDRWPEPEGLYAWVEEAGHLPRRRLYETFNMGIGFTVVLDPAASSEALRRLHRKGYGDARIVGRVERGTGVDLPHLGLRYEGYQ